MVEHSFMAHPETLLPMTEEKDPVRRFVAVVKFYLSGWHIKPPYVILEAVASSWPPANVALEVSRNH